MKITDGTKNIIAALIVAFGLILTVYFYESVHRYIFVDEYSSGYVIKIDKWTGKRTVIDTRDGRELKGCKLNERGFPIPNN